MEPIEAVRRAIAGGKRAALITVRSTEGEPPSKPGLRLAVTEEGDVFGSLGCDGFDASGESDGRLALRRGGSFEQRYEWDATSSIAVEIKPYGPGDVIADVPAETGELLVVGRGPVAKALVSLGEAMGFTVRVAAGPEPPGVGDFYGADEVIVATDSRDVEALRPGPNAYVVICGHDEEFSVPALKALLRTEAPYLGMMGSRRHTGHLYQELRDEGFSEADLSRVHSPVGLDIGAETPEEIALSALAQIVSTRRGGTGGNLDRMT